jgi:hypothetical protein
MRDPTWRIGCVSCRVFLCAALSLGIDPAADNAAPPSKSTKYKQAAIALATGAAEGMELAGKVIEQKTRAEANWKKVFKEGKAPHLETDNLLLFGKPPNKSLDAIGAVLERQFILARKTLGLEEEAPWPGKLAVYFFADRGKFTSFIRTVEGRRPESEDLGSFHIRSDFPHVAAGPPREAPDPSLEAQAAEQLASALIVKKAGTTLPEWVLVGFGRATYYRAAGPREYLGERKRAARLLAARKASAMDVWDNNLPAEAAPVLRGSLVDFLALGPGKAKFLAFLEGYKPGENMVQKTTADAFKAANISPKIVNQKWKAWVRR